jgi:hypothetical protein
VVRHIFAWRVAPGYDGNEIIAILNTLPKKLPDTVRGWDIGQHKGEPGDNGDPWDGVLVADFASWEALETYSNDPYHLSVVDTLMPMFAERQES